MAYHTLLDAAYAMYYPEAEFGIKDTLSGLKSRVGRKIKKTKKSFRTGLRAGSWNAGGGRHLSANPEARAYMRSKDFRSAMRGR